MTPVQAIESLSRKLADVIDSLNDNGKVFNDSFDEVVRRLDDIEERLKKIETGKNEDSIFN